MSQTGVAQAAQSWTTLTASDASANARLGTSVAVSADGSTAVTGSPTRTVAGAAAVGAAYAYLGIPIGTVLDQKETAVLTPAAADGEDASSKFGASVATSSDGRTVVVGAPGTGNVYVFTRTGTATTWTKTAKLRAPCCTAGSFGQTLALSSDGNRLLVGSPDSVSFTAKGSVWYYAQTSPGTWALQSTTVGGSAGAHIGTALALSNNGLVAALGSPTYSETSTSGTKTTKPKVDLYNVSATALALQATFSDPSGKATSNFGGAGLALDAVGRSMAVGAPGVTTSPATTAVLAGTVYTYITTSNLPDSRLSKSASTGAGEGLGAAVALSPDGLKVVAGSPLARSSSQNYIWTRTSTMSGFTTASSPVTTSTLTGQSSGSSIAFGTNSRLLIGNPSGTTAGPTASGSASLVDLS